MSLICTLGQNYTAMKLFYPVVICLAIVHFSCNNQKPVEREKQQAETPKALQADNGSGSEVSFLSKKRYEDDLVEQLYDELLKKNKQLADLENNISQLKENSKDSAVAFNAFDNKNNSYYTAANGHLDAIKDSAIKQRISLLISNSLSKYKNTITVHQSLLDVINKKDLRLDDLHVVLKLTQTLAMIEKYQSVSLPSTKPLEAVSKKYDKIIAATDSLSKK